MWERSPLKHAQTSRPRFFLPLRTRLALPDGAGRTVLLALKWLDKPAELLRRPRSNHDLTRTGPPTLQVDHFKHIARFLSEHVPA